MLRICNRNLSGLTDRTGRTVRYTHDTLDRLTQVTEGPEHVLASYHYHKGGPLQTLRYGNGLQTEYHYQEDGSPAGLVTMTAQGNVLLNLRYAYDGNCTEKSGEPYQNTYTYDRMNRLTGSIQDGKGVRYAYDPAGNRLKKETGQETETYRYNAKNQLTERRTREGIIRYRYDPQGNLLEEQGRTGRKQYTYDAAGRSAFPYPNRRMEQTGKEALSSSTAMTEKICVTRRKKTGKSSAFFSTGVSCRRKDGKMLRSVT